MWRPMYAEERQQAIAAQILARGRSPWPRLALEYDVTTETVRRDLAALDRAGLIRRSPRRRGPRPRPHIVEEPRLMTSGLHRRTTRTTSHTRPNFCQWPGLDPDRRGHDNRTPRGAGCQVRKATHGGKPTRVPIAARPRTERHHRCQLLGGWVRGPHPGRGRRTGVTGTRFLRVDIAFIGTNGDPSGRHGCRHRPDEAAIKRAMVRARTMLWFHICRRSAARSSSVCTAGQHRHRSPIPRSPAPAPRTSPATNTEVVVAEDHRDHGNPEPQHLIERRPRALLIRGGARTGAVTTRPGRGVCRSGLSPAGLDH